MAVRMDKYENDTRINMICGRNQLGTYDANGADYIFCRGEKRVYYRC